MTTTDRAAADTGRKTPYRRRPTQPWRERLDARIIRCEWHGPQWESCKHCEADA